MCNKFDGIPKIRWRHDIPNFRQAKTDYLSCWNLPFEQPSQSLDFLYVHSFLNNLNHFNALNDQNPHYAFDNPQHRSKIIEVVSNKNSFDMLTKIEGISHEKKKI